MLKIVFDFFEKVDKNGDGELDFEDIEDHVRKFSNLIIDNLENINWFHYLTKTQKISIKNEQIKSRTKEILAYHDANFDHKIQKPEMFFSLLQWNVLSVKHEKIKKLNIVDKILNLEKNFVKHFGCASADSPECQAEFHRSKFFNFQKFKFKDFVRRSLIFCMHF